MARFLLRLLLFFLAGCQLFGADPPVFHRANFLGLIVGKATTKDLEQRVGKPRETSLDQAGTLWLYYTNIGPIKGKVEVIAVAKTGVIKSIVLYPEDGILFGQLTAYFGPNYRIVLYSFDTCLDDGGS